MALISLGVIIPGGNGPMVATSNLQRAAANTVTNIGNPVSPQTPVPAASFRVYQWPGNTGKIYVGGANMESQSGDGLFGWVPEISSVSAVPNSPSIYYDSPAASTGDVRNTYDMNSVFVDTDNATDAVLIMYLEI